MALEQQGVPTVAVHTDRFERLVRTCARAGGMPTARQAFVPQPVVDRTTAELRAYIEGEDPITRRPFVHELIEGLTRPLDATDAGLTFDRSIGRLLEPGSDEELRARFGQNRWTDFLPIVLPTEERVERMLTG
ncbi:MAG TPA: UGSC family (seleno)protein, partial [Solirubrobacteraceae bacterium]|nr:UGSC family (seleno)protein [Solirubrobacteraceae bacterium]